jgi:hypothetical protein
MPVVGEDLRVQALFFRMGVIASVFRVGTMPDVRDAFTILTTRGQRTGRHALTKAEGMGSREQVVVLDLENCELMMVLGR